MDVDALHHDRLTITTRGVEAAPDEYGQPVYTSHTVTVGHCNVQPITAADAALFDDANHATRYKVFGPTELADLITGDSVIEWQGRWFTPSSTPFVWAAPDGLGIHVELWMEQTNVDANQH